MAHEDFRRALTRAYLENPCQVLANPLWKTLAELDSYETAFAADAQGVTRLEAFDEDSLYIYWRRDNRQPSMVITRRLEFQQRALIHQDFLDAPTVAGYRHFASYYRLIHRGQPEENVALPEGFRFADMLTSPEDAQMILAQIEQQAGQSLNAVQDWLTSPTLTPDLWLWVVDSASDQPAGLGIAELDTEQREANLLWVQIMPEYQRRGLGRAVVSELLRRIGDRAAFTTVSGEVEDRDNPGAFFRRCGFTGDDVWWVLDRTT